MKPLRTEEAAPAANRSKPARATNLAVQSRAHRAADRSAKTSETTTETTRRAYSTPSATSINAPLTTFLVGTGHVQTRHPLFVAWAVQKQPSKAPDGVRAHLPSERELPDHPRGYSFPGAPGHVSAVLARTRPGSASAIVDVRPICRMNTSSGCGVEPRLAPSLRSESGVASPVAVGPSTA